MFEYRIGAGAWESATDAQENVFTIANLCSTGGIAATLPMDTATDFFELDFTEYAVFRLRFFNEYETGTTVTATVPVVFANFHLAGCKTGGASFGGFSTSTEGNPLFECRYPAYFYGGIAEGGIGAHGVTAAQTIGTSRTVSFNIDFGKTFAAPPTVVVTVETTEQSLCIPCVHDITTTGCVVGVRNDSSSASKSVKVHWVAM